jgi:hypothetical protein
MHLMFGVVALFAHQFIKRTEHLLTATNREITLRKELMNFRNLSIVSTLEGPSVGYPRLALPEKQLCPSSAYGKDIVFNAGKQ